MFSGYTPRTMQMILAILVVFLSSSAAQAQEIDWGSVWKQYNAATHRLCPSHNLEDLSDGQYDDVPNGFLQNYPAATQSRISKIVDYPKTCAAETAGFSCEFGAHLNAFQQIGLFHEFVTYSCRHWRCDYAAMCKSIP
jgi:hypothetical protein